jgi:hypothetical protein
MNIQLIPYMTGAITVHALLMSLGALLVVNSVRALAEMQQYAWVVYLDAKTRGVSITDVPTQNEKIERIIKGLIRGMGVNLFAGCFGILLALLAIAFSWEGFQAGLFLELSLAGVMWQLVWFSFLSLNVMRYLRGWIQKVP